MKILCPHCDSQIPADKLNVATDVAICERCHEVFAISSLVASGQVPDDFHFDEPPPGAWFEETGLGWKIGATTRSAIAFFLVPFMCVWSGFSLGGIYGSQIIKGEFNLGMSLFGIPFLLGTIAIGTVVLMSVCGQIIVSTEDNEGRIFAGVGPIGWTRRFAWDTIHSVEEDFMVTQQSGSTGMVIALVGQTRLKFGSMLTDARHYYMMQCLRTFLGEHGRPSKSRRR